MTAILTTLVRFAYSAGHTPRGVLMADANGDLFGNDGRRPLRRRGHGVRDQEALERLRHKPHHASQLQLPQRGGTRGRAYRRREWRPIRDDDLRWTVRQWDGVRDTEDCSLAMRAGRRPWSASTKPTANIPRPPGLPRKASSGWRRRSARTYRMFELVSETAGRRLSAIPVTPSKGLVQWVSVL
jgi:hypothetical protein